MITSQQMVGVLGVAALGIIILALGVMLRRLGIFFWGALGIVGAIWLYNHQAAEKTRQAEKAIQDLQHETLLNQIDTWLELTDPKKSR